MTAPTPDVDALRLVISTLASCLPGVWVADTLPERDALADALPAVRVDLLPGDELTPFGGPTGPVVDLVALDIDVLARSRAEAAPVAKLVRDILHQLPMMPGTGVTYVECPAMSTRPDMNPHVRRLGVDAEIHLGTPAPHIF